MDMYDAFKEIRKLFWLKGRFIPEEVDSRIICGIGGKKCLKKFFKQQTILETKLEKNKKILNSDLIDKFSSSFEEEMCFPSTLQSFLNDMQNAIKDNTKAIDVIGKLKESKNFEKIYINDLYIYLKEDEKDKIRKLFLDIKSYNDNETPHLFDRIKEKVKEISSQIEGEIKERVREYNKINDAVKGVAGYLYVMAIYLSAFSGENPIDKEFDYPIRNGSNNKFTKNLKIDNFADKELLQKLNDYVSEKFYKNKTKYKKQSILDLISCSDESFEKLYLNYGMITNSLSAICMEDFYCGEFSSIYELFLSKLDTDNLSKSLSESLTKHSKAKSKLDEFCGLMKTINSSLNSAKELLKDLTKDQVIDELISKIDQLLGCFSKFENKKYDYKNDIKQIFESENIKKSIESLVQVYNDKKRFYNVINILTQLFNNVKQCYNSNIKNYESWKKETFCYIDNNKVNNKDNNKDNNKGKKLNFFGMVKQNVEEVAEKVAKKAAYSLLNSKYKWGERYQKVIDSKKNKKL